MKYNSLVKCSLVAIMALTTTLSAQENKASLLASDKTLAKSERKVILGIKSVGLEADKFTFPVYYTPAGKKAKTILLGNWSVSLKHSFANEVLAENYSFLISNRYDKLIFDNQQAMILTATKDVKVKINNLPALDNSLSSYEAFKNRVLAYLNKNVASKVTKVLSEAKDARYNEMNEKEVATFITTKAKEVGIPAALLQKLLDSSYAFSIYMPKLTGQVNIYQIETKDSEGRTIIVYSTSFNAPITLKLTAFKFKDGKFVFTKEINSESGDKTDMVSGFMESISKSVSGSASVTTPYRPSQSQLQGIFEKAFKTSFKDNVMALNTKLKEDREFAIVSPVTSAKGASATIAVGNQEDIRVDHPFKILRTEDDKENLMGYAKVRRAGDNCLLLPESERTESKVDMIMGETEEADLAVEHPWTGVFGTIYASHNSGEFTYDKDSTVEGTGATNMLNIGFSGDLGYVLNKQALSEVWVNMSLGLGMATYGTLPTISGYAPEGDDGFAYKFNLGVEKRFYPMSSLYLSGTLDVSYESQSYSYENDYSLSLSTLSVLPAIRTGYMFNPNIDVFLAIGYDVPLSTSAALKDTDDNEINIPGTFSKDPGINAKFGVNLHLNFAGPFAKMFEKPSQRCDSLKK